MKKMETISILKAIDSKPSKALEFMVEGLLKQTEREDFILDSSNFGDMQGGFCVGCFATCTIQEIANKNFVNLNIRGVLNRAEYLGFEAKELGKFEYAMDSARASLFSLLFSFCGLKTNPSDFNLRSDTLTESNWKEQLPKVRKVIKQLKKLGL